MSKSQPPAIFNFYTVIPIRITDINYGNHLGNDSFLSLLHEARVQYLKKAALSELEFGDAGLIMRDAEIQFKGEVFYGDAVKIEVAIAGFSRAGFDMFYRMTHASSERLIATARTGMVCFNYAMKKVVEVPAAARQMIGDTFGE